MDISGVCSYLTKLLGTEITDRYHGNVSLWRDWYQGYYKPFHHYLDYNGNETLELDRYSLKMGKRVCEEWANLLLNEKVQIKVSNEYAESFLKDVLNENSFFKNANMLVETTFALGTGAFVLRLDKSKIKIDYITADCIIPISAENGRINEVCFASEFTKKGESYIYAQVHLLNEQGNYVIHNICLDSSYKEVPLDGITSKFETNDCLPWFYIISPNINNNEDMSSPMGISVFANSIDILKGIDLAYDNLCTDFYLGGKMVVMNDTVIAKEQNGRRIAPFHSKKRLFMSIGDSIVDGKLFEEYNPQLRVEENTNGIKIQLALLCASCGLGNNYFSFNHNEIKTATEVISENSVLYRAIKKHEILLGEQITHLITAILKIGGFFDVSVKVLFDDGIIEDRKSLREQDRADVSLGIMTKEEYREKYYEH